MPTQLENFERTVGISVEKTVDFPPIINSEDCQPVPGITLCVRNDELLSRDLSYSVPYSTLSSHTAGGIHISAITVLLQSCLPIALNIGECLRRSSSAPTAKNGIFAVLVMVY